MADWTILQGRPKVVGKDDRVMQTLMSKEAAGVQPKVEDGTMVEQKTTTPTVSTPVTTTPVTTQQRVNYSQPTKEEQEAERQRTQSYADVLRIMREEADKHKEPSMEEQKAADKRRKREMWVTAMADGLNALINVIGTSKGAYNQFDPKETMTGKLKERYDAVDAKREADRGAYLNYMQKIANLNQSNADYLRKLREGNRDQQRKDDEQERKMALTEAQAGRQKAAEAKDTAMAAYYNAKEDAIIQGLPLEEANKKADTALKLARANNVGVKSSGGGRKSTSSGTTKTATGKYHYYTRDGEERFAASTEEAKRRAIEEGTWVEKTEGTSNKVYDNRGRLKSERRGKRVVGGYSKPKGGGVITGVSWISSK